MKKQIIIVMMAAGLLVTVPAAAQTTGSCKAPATCPVSKPMSINNRTTVGEMAVQEPKAIAIYKELGIDYCCMGGKNLKEALKEKNVTTEAFMEKLAFLKKESDKTPVVDYVSMSPEALAGYIDNKHHEYLREALPETSALFETVLRVHGANHPDLYETYRLFGTLKTNLEAHLIREETKLFPQVSNLNNPKMKELVATIKEEHEVVGELLEDLRKETNDYALPADACVSFKSLYASMQEMEDDLHEHIHVENNILLK